MAGEKGERFEVVQKVNRGQCSKEKVLFNCIHDILET